MAQDTVRTLREIELFRTLSQSELQHIHALAIERRMERGSYVFMEGEEREAVYFIRRGLVKIFRVDEDGREHIVNILGAGEMFPHVGFFDDSPYPATAQVLEPSDILSIRCVDFDALLVAYPDIARKLLHVMGRKILQLQAKLKELAVFDTHERVIALIRHFAEEYGVAKDDGVHLHLPVTHGEMARMIGITRESVNRVWNELRRDGVIEGARDEWVIHIDRLPPR